MPGFFVGDRADLIFPELYRHHIMLGKLAWHAGDLPNNEALIFLVNLVRSGYAPVVEFGTFRGRTAYNLAINTPEYIYTIDNGSFSSEGSANPDYEYADAPLAACITSDVSSRVIQIACDSRYFDAPMLEGHVGLVIVDGSHERDIVRSDSEKALRLIRPDGVIVWDDCNDSWPGVKEVVQGLALERNMLSLHREGLVISGAMVDPVIQSRLVTK